VQSGKAEAGRPLADDAGVDGDVHGCSASTAR
jgi:hypothetical protein